MSRYSVGDKFIIEIGEVYNGDISENSNPKELYRIKGFRSLVFDNNGLDFLEKIEDVEKENIKVGDIVYNDSTLEEGVITHIDHDEVFMLYSDGSCGLAEGNLTKTGKRFDVADVLNVLKEKEKE